MYYNYYTGIIIYYITQNCFLFHRSPSSIGFSWIFTVTNPMVMKSPMNDGNINMILLKTHGDI